MHRIKNGHEYYAIPGGTIEKNETPEQTAIREIKEETSLDIELDKLLWEYDDTYAYCYYFSVKNISGKDELGGPELEISNSNNHYNLEWVDIAKIDKIALYPLEIAKRIKNTFTNKKQA